MADTPQVRKFMFDKSFDDAATIHRSTPERKPVTLKPEQVDALKKESWDAGFAAGSKTASDEQSQKMANLFSQIEARLSALAGDVESLHKIQEGHLRSAIMAIARKILPDFVARNGLAEIEALLAEAIGNMLHEPRLVVRIHESQFDTVNARIAEITAQRAYAGKVVVLADDTVAAGDCRIEWADGGIERNTKAVWRDIENAVTPDQHNPATSSQE